MNKKNMGRKFKVGDKVKLTKAGEESGAFASGFREGDVAEVLLLNSFDDFISSVKVITGKAVGYLQYCDTNTDTRAWFEHVSNKKKRKKKEKKRKHFRMGDLVVLKENLSSGFPSRWGDLPKNTIAVVYGADLDGAVKVEFINHLEDKNFEYCSDYIKPEALRLATKEERKALRKHKVAKITYDDLATEENEQDIEAPEAKVPPEYDVKVGDIVKTTCFSVGHAVGTIGEVTLVKDIEEADNRYNRVVVRDNGGSCFHEHDVKLVYRKPETNSK